MTRLRSLMLLALLVAAPAAYSQDDPLAAVPRITQAELKKLLAARTVLVIDVRDQPSFEAGHIPDAISIPGTKLSEHLERLKSETRRIVTYCA